MTRISIRDLIDHADDVVSRAARGEHITITRAGKVVAEMGPVLPSALPAEVLLERWRRLPPLDPGSLRADVGRHLDSPAA